MKPVASHLPPLYEGVKQSDALCECYDALLGELKFPAEQMFINTADDVSRWESEIGIMSSPDETLEFRRARIINRYCQSGAFTMKYLHLALSRLLPCPFEVYRNHALRTIFIKTELMQHGLVKEFLHTMEAIVPLTMDYKLVLTSYSEPFGTLFCAGVITQCLTFTAVPTGQL